MDNKIENKKPKDEIEATSPELQILSSVPAAAQNLLPKSLFTGLRPPLYPLHPGSYPYSLLSPSEMSQFSPWWVRHNLNSFLNSNLPGLAIIFWRKVIILLFYTNFCPIKNDRSGDTVWPQTLGLKKLSTIFGTLNDFLFTQNVKVA